MLGDRRCLSCGGWFVTIHPNPVLHCPSCRRQDMIKAQAAGMRAERRRLMPGKVRVDRSMPGVVKVKGA